MTALSKAMATIEDAKVFEKEIVHRQGKDICIDDWIQAGKVGTNIYDVIETYGLDYAKQNMGIAGLKAIVEDVSKINGLQDVMMMNKRAIEAWEKMPIEIKQKFGNNRLEFAANGHQWLKDELKKLEEANKPVSNDKVIVKKTEEKEENK